MRPFHTIHAIIPFNFRFLFIALWFVAIANKLIRLDLLFSKWKHLSICYDDKNFRVICRTFSGQPQSFQSFLYACVCLLFVEHSQQQYMLSHMCMSPPHHIRILFVGLILFSLFHIHSIFLSTVIIFHRECLTLWFSLCLSSSHPLLMQTFFSFFRRFSIHFSTYVFFSQLIIKPRIGRRGSINY